MDAVVSRLKPEMNRSYTDKPGALFGVDLIFFIKGVVSKYTNQ